ncbi:MAG: RNA polymerase sigma factor [Candidatus Zixiibacteriota bacterium]|nr:MAG: RNA polymerase sigma factor [candidate division Zixibacteria bacterium]
MDNELFWKLLKPVHPEAASFCRKLMGDPDEGDDLYQDALVSALNKFESLRRESAFRPWLFRIMVNNYRNRCRQVWWRRRVPLSQEVIETVAGRDPMGRYEAQRQLRYLMANLSAEDRALVVLHEIEGWATSELAGMLNKPEGTIKTRLFRARAKMRRTLERHLPKNKANSTSLEVAYAMQRCKTMDE